MAFRLFSITMFIEVSEGVLRIAQRNSDKEHIRAVETLRQLSWAIRKNHHLVFFPSLNKDKVDGLKGILNDNELAAIQYSFSKKNDLLKIKSLLPCYALVSFDEVTSRRGNIILINPWKDNNYELFEKCHLLTENLIDSEFYQNFAVAYQRSNHIVLEAFRTSFYALQGGGAATKQVFVYECKLKEHFCLAILDSDKKWPNYKGYGQTANLFEEEYNQYVKDNGLPIACHYYIMNLANEAENLIPIEVLKKHSNNDQKEFLNNYPSALPWFDLKKGLEYRLLYDKPDAFNEWRNVFPNEMDWPHLASLISQSQDVNIFLSKIQSEKIKPIIKEWGISLLNNVLHPDRKHQNMYNLRSVDLSRLSPEQKSEWATIGSLVFNWCCCFSKKMY